MPSTGVHRHGPGGNALVVGLHGYGGDEWQLGSLLPLALPVVRCDLRAPLRVDPGYGWWLPEAPAAGRARELAPTDGVDAAVAEVIERIREAQAAEGIGPHRTALVGYSQGATLALTVAARRPELVAAVATGAGALLPGETVAVGNRPLDVLIMNGTLDPVIGAADHAETVRRFQRAGHRIRSRRDPVPHVIDAAQPPAVSQFLADVLPVGPAGPAGSGATPVRPVP